MQARTNAILVLAYGVIAITVMGLVFWSGAQHQQTERLIAELHANNARGDQRRVSEEATETRRRSIRPVLVRLQRSLEERAQLIRDQQSQLKQQIQGREQLLQQHEQLSVAYNQLSHEHALLLNEVAFYLSAFRLASGDEGPASVEDVSAGDTLSTGQALAGPEGEDFFEQLTDGEIAELAEMEVTRLRDEIDELNATYKRDSLIASYASLAMVEMGASAVPVLSAILDDKNAEARAWAAWVLGQIGPAAAISAGKLERLLDDENEDVAKAAAEALQSMMDRISSNDVELQQFLEGRRQYVK